MKTLLKYIRNFVFVFLGLIALLFLSILDMRQNRGQQEGSINVEYNMNGKVLNFDKPNLVYANSKEEALYIADVDYYFGEDSYMNQVNYIIKVFENDDYAALYYHAIKNREKEGTVMTKFKIKIKEGKKQYALINAARFEAQASMMWWNPKPLEVLRSAAPLYDFLTEYSINDGKRFIFGSLNTEKVKTLKIEGQSPTEIIEYTLFGEPNYFWYYEDLISDKPSSEFNIELEE